MPPMKEMKPMAKPENTFAALKRIFSYMHGFRIQFVLVVIGIFFSAFAGIAGNYLLKPIIDNLEDAFKTGHWKYGKFIGILTVMVVIYAVGALSSLFYQRVMMKISTTTLMRIRNDLFCKMEMLPIRFFDKHTHGELMSLYTNDTDAIREMLSNSIAQFISSAITIVGVFTAMLIYSWRLTILVVAVLFVIVKVIGFVGSRSGKGFAAQQKALGKVNGYIEEMIDGQKVVKVFCHEDKAAEEFDALNEELCEAATHANTFANVLMPIMNNLSYIHYAMTAIVATITLWRWRALTLPWNKLK